MNKFTESELKGRNILKSFLDQVGATNQMPTEDEYNPVDYYFTYKEKKVVAEIKCRDIKYLNYPTHLMEVSKYNALMKDKQNKQLDTAYYINFFGENIAYWYSNSTIRKYATKDIKYCNRTTAENRGCTNKSVLLIPTDKAQIFIRKNGIWSNGSLEEIRTFVA